MSFKTLLVADQNAANILKIETADSPCCGDTARTCEYTTTYTAANTVSGITITNRAGASQALTFAAVSGAANVIAAIKAALAAAGYEDVSDSLESIAITGTTTFTVVAYSDVPLISIAASGGTATFTAKCIAVTLCNSTATISASAAAPTLSVNGKNAAMAAIVYGTTLGSAIATNINAVLTASGVLNATATVTPSTATGPYTVVFTAPVQTTIKTNWLGTGVFDLLDQTGCATDWV